MEATVRAQAADTHGDPHPVARILVTGIREDTVGSRRPAVPQTGEPVPPLTLSREQNAVFEAIEGTRDHVFVTGRAGTGKSTLLNHLNWNTQKQIVICFCVFQLRWLSRVDLPVPARPVTNT